MTPPKVLHHIFRAYDIRGTIGSELGTETAWLIGYAFALQVPQGEPQDIVVAYDGRLSSPELHKAIISGVQAAGRNAISVGRGPTPYLYYCDQHLNAAAAIMVTGSHNEAHINGLKMVLGHQPFCGEKIQELYQSIVSLDMNKIRGWAVCPSYPTLDLTASYLNHMLADFEQHYSGMGDLKIVWDPGNGASGELVSQMVKRLPGEHLVINGDVDGTFPAHHPDPSIPENLAQLIAMVRQTQSNLGIAFDGDGDRIGVVTAQGQILWGEQLVEIFAREVLDWHPGAFIIADVKTSNNFLKAIKNLAGNPLLWKTGHSFIKEKMKETGALLAAEMSGHIFFADRYFGYDDALYAALRLIGAINLFQIDLDAWLADRPPSFSTPEIRLPCTGKFAIIIAMKEMMQKNGQPFNDLDGIRVDGEHGWWMVRASNTQEMIIARAEANNPKDLLISIKQLTTLLSPHGLELQGLDVDGWGQSSDPEQLAPTAQIQVFP